MRTHLLLFHTALLGLAQISHSQTIPQQLWSRDLAFPLASSERVVVDSTGHAVACSGTYLFVPATQSHHIFQTTKLRPDGQPLWTREYRPAGGWNERAYWLTVDSEDNVIVTGRALPAQSANFQSVTIKYDPAGNVLWEHVRAGSGFGYTSIRVEVDATGNVYLLGTGDTSGSLFEVTKLDPAGNLLWSRGVTPVTGVPTRLNALAVAPDGRVAYTAGIQDLDFYSRCYDSQGALIWSDRYAGGLLGGQDITFDATGAAYVCGSANGAGVVVKYGPTGSREWTMSRNGPGGSFDSYHRVTLDVAGNIVATGQGQGSGLYLQWATVKVDPTGTLLWARDYEGIAANDQRARAITTDSSGSVYVAGFALPASAPCTTTLSDVDTVAIKYDASGTLQWTLHSLCSGGFGNSIAVAPGGDIVLNTPDSVERWSQFALPENFCQAVPNSTGQIGHLDWVGTTEITANDFSLIVQGTLPPTSFGLLAASQVETSVPMVGGYVGTLCLGTPTGRGTVFQVDAGGSVTVPIDPQALPTALGPTVSAVAGETWLFQLWHRDLVNGAPNANFTDGLRVPWR
ncbi:hypothetical protein Poly30_55860 [Planctomycetes bacterium Poly30]|uniref:Beta-propeller repeat protein n=1 Tax=Saltatorellus ferox TaxID=2528018 RepID=A0A518F111_9BACT|nr:hypothetical protein Poly30_55860 [Planctomycetes bacterium Poly30]